MKKIIPVSYFISLVGCCIILMAGCRSDNEHMSELPENNPLSELDLAISNDSLNHALLFKRAGLAYEAENFDRAIDDLEKAISIEPDVPEYYHLLSDVYLDYFRSREALEVIEQAGARFPERVATQLKLSETQFILKQYQESLLTLAKVLTLEPQNAEALFMMGMNFRSMGETDKAINALQTATELDPELIDAWLILGQMFEDQGNPIALDYYDAAIRIAPDLPEARHSKAFYLQNTGKPLEAIGIYKEINRIDKYYLDAYLNAGILYMELDSFRQAWDQFNIMANLRTQNHLAYYYRGLASESMGKIKAARKDYENALNLKPGFQRAIIALNNLEE